MRSWIAVAALAASGALAVSAKAEMLAGYSFGYVDSYNNSTSPNVVGSHVSASDLTATQSAPFMAPINVVVMDFYFDFGRSSDYFEWTVTPQSGYRMTLSSLDYSYFMNQYGAVDGYQLCSSLDGFSSAIYSKGNLADGYLVDQNVMLSSSFSNLTSAVTFRIYADDPTGGWFGIGAGSSGYLAVDGTTVAVPEPTLLGAAGLLLPLLGRRRQQLD